MSSPTDDIDLKPEKMEEEKEGGAFHCDLYDMDIVHKIAQEFLPGLGSACIDNTTGGLFSSPASVAVEIRREMVDYLVQRSETFVAESVVLEAGPNEDITKDPYDIISDFIDDFASSKRNFFSRVSGWLLSERREDKIDDFVQEMEINGFWLLNRRESIAQTLLKNVDFKNLYHCIMSFKTEEELEEHKSKCSFRTMMCASEGCNSIFSAAQQDHHDSICPFKILKCEQNCSESIMRREMDRHCITICPMKLVKCPFYSVGCHSSIPQSTVGQHRLEDLSCHLLYVQQVVHKEASEDDLKERVEELIKLSSPGQLAAARDARSLTYAIKDLEAKLGPLKVKTTEKRDDETDGDSPHKVEKDGESPSKEAKPGESPSKDGKSGESLSKDAKSGESPSAARQSVSSKSSSDGGEDPSQEMEKLVELSNVDDQSELVPPVSENSTASLSAQEAKQEKLSQDNSSESDKDENVTSSPVKVEENDTSAAALDSQPHNSENSVSTNETREVEEEKPKSDSESDKELEEGPGKGEEQPSSSSPIKVQEEDQVDQGESHVASAADDENKDAAAAKSSSSEESD
ncbi:uncharacterized protein LOC127264218 [Andrographis paniculata]|uniref:uncharacterized protein LOC127264218 n=1 Tax=Andrographis paniculata TaxID=175694 RepID=UPI0021E897CC|nr:uncharacterized protein LOC127264218 [Andrographis paniculata]XP_051149633.1 uncharacterized protein LOC127264218 [Andrographis paniculata]